MKVKYKYEIRYRPVSRNNFKLAYVKTLDKEGNEIYRKVNGRPYTEYFTRRLYSNHLDKANAISERLKSRGMKFVRVIEGSFEVEEISI